MIGKQNNLESAFAWFSVYLIINFIKDVTRGARTAYPSVIICAYLPLVLKPGRSGHCLTIVVPMNWLLIGFQTNPFMSENHYTLLTNKYTSLKHNVGSEMIGIYP
jgi:hypothetical protein